MFENQTEKQELDSNASWNNIEPQITQTINEFVCQKAYAGDSEEKLVAKEKTTMLAAEKFFFVSTLDKINEFYKNNPKQQYCLLFDIDDTIGKEIFDKTTGKQIGTNIRPSAIPLFEAIKSNFDNIQIGLLTARDKEAVLKDLNEEKSLKQIRNYISREIVFSSCGNGDAILLSTMSEKQKRDLLIKHPLAKEFSPDKLEVIAEKLLPGDISKLIALQAISSQKPDYEIMIVDDLRYPNYLKNGISLYPDAKF